jgi:hypothetical protein
LSAKAWVQAALVQANTDLPRAKLVLEQLQLPENAAAGAAFRRMVRHIVEPNGARPHRNLKHLTGEEAENTLARIGASREVLLACAAVHAAKHHPDAFGDCDDPEGLSGRLAKLATERDRLYAEIESSWQRSDVTLLPVSGDDAAKGLCRICFSMTLDGGTVFLTPDSPQHLVEWWSCGRGSVKPDYVARREKARAA